MFFVEEEMENAKQIVKDYVSRELADESKQTALKEEENLLANGIIDSLGILKLVSFIEQEFDIRVPDEDVTVQNFRSLKDIANYLETKK
jgi:acyl carrier protein